jgi:superfamily II DNA/RNA helicase
MRRGQVRVLVATDVAARGIDVPTITHVVNYDLPKFPEDYVHRIGRTGRAGRNGLAISLVNHAENMNVRRIERFTKQTIPVDVVEGFEPKRSAPARSGARPGWKPGDGRNAAKPGQRSFSKPAYGAPREGGYADRAPREGGYARPADSRPADSRYADRGPREGFGAPRTGGYGDRPQREGGYRGAAPREGAPASAPREGGYRGNRPEGARREGGYNKSAHPRSADGARRSFGEY